MVVLGVSLYLLDMIMVYVFYSGGSWDVGD